MGFVIYFKNPYQFYLKRKKKIILTDFLPHRTVLNRLGSPQTASETKIASLKPCQENRQGLRPPSPRRPINRPRRPPF